MVVRPPDFAGSWYPGTASGVRDGLAEMRAARPDVRTFAGSPCGGVVPHAGWAYSGAIAYGVLRSLKEAVSAPDVVVVFGGHLRQTSPACTMTEGAWGTPLGEIPIEVDLARDLAERCDLEVETAARHARDNGIELILPFIRDLWPQARLLPVGVPPVFSAASSIGCTLGEMLAGGGRRAIAIGSTDLTHYGPNYGWAPKGTGREALAWMREINDRRFIDALVRADAEGAIDDAIAHRSACCPGAAAAAIACATAMTGAGTPADMEGHLLEYATSHDIRPSGPPESFVGYAGVVLWRRPPQRARYEISERISG